MQKEVKKSWALFMGIGVMMIAHGLQMQLMGIRSVLEGFSVLTTGIFMSGYYVGYFIGSKTTPNFVSKVGHSAVIGKLCVAIFAFFFVKDFALVGTDMIFIPIMCVMCVAIPFVLVTIAPRFITAAEVNLFFLLETIIGPIWVWLIIKEQPSTQTILGGIVIIITIAIHSLLAIKKTQTKTT